MGRVGPPGHAYDAPRNPRDLRNSAREARSREPVVFASIRPSRPRLPKTAARRFASSPAGRGLPPAWTLTAPESHLLQWGEAGRASDLEAFRLGLLDLIVRGALRADQAWVCGRLRRWRLEWLYGWGPNKGDVHEPALMPLLDVHARAWQRGHWIGFSRDHHDVTVEGVRFKDLMYARSFWRASWHGFLNGPVAAALEARELRRTDGSLTPAGRDAEKQLARWLRVGQAASHTRDASFARAYLAGAGASALLIPEAVPALAELRSFDPTFNLAAFESSSGWFSGLGDLAGGDFGGCDGGGC